MSEALFEKCAALRVAFPDDLAPSETEEKRIHELLRLKEYAAHPMTQELLKAARATVIECRRKLASDRSLLQNPEVAYDLWALIDARMWFIDMVSRDVDGELTLIEAGLDAELQR